MLLTSQTLIIGSLKLQLHENGEKFARLCCNILVRFFFMNHKYLIYLELNTIRSKLHFVNRHK